MAPSTVIGDLTQAGWLYEGNFEEWRARMIAHWTLSGYSHRHMLNMESLPALLRRVPAADRKDSALLYVALVARTKPFRLFDLPVEIRSMIYELAMARDGEAFLTLDRCDEDIDFLLPLLYASSAVRAEAMPVFFRTMRFSYEHVSRFGTTLTTQVLRWARAMEPRYLRHLRFFTYIIEANGDIPYLEVTVTFSLEPGLDVEYSAKYGGGHYACFAGAEDG